MRASRFCVFPTRTAVLFVRENSICCINAVHEEKWSDLRIQFAFRKRHKVIRVWNNTRVIKLLCCYTEQTMLFSLQDIPPKYFTQCIRVFYCPEKSHMESDQSLSFLSVISGSLLLVSFPELNACLCLENLPCCLDTMKTLIVRLEGW